MSGAVKRLICRLFGHRKVAKRVFVVFRPLPHSAGFFNVGVGSNLPGDLTVDWLKAVYGEFGYVEERIFCERCERWLDND